MAHHLDLAVKELRNRLGNQAPKLAFVLGSGFSEFGMIGDSREDFPTSLIPGAVDSSVEGHSGRLILTRLKNKTWITVSGRVHGYEGNSPHQVVFLLRALRAWGVSTFVLTNASGSTSKKFAPGSLVLLKDQINATGQSPLTGRELYGGLRFPDMSEPFSKSLRLQAKKLGQSLKIKLQEGVYIGVNGPAFETPAEIKMYNKWGADLVGMSTVWESTALVQMNAEIVGLSCVSNFGTGVISKKLSHEDVLETTKKIKSKMIALLSGMAKLWA